MSRATAQPPAPKRIRTCIACGAKSSKMELMRVVRTPRGTIELDVGGRMAGRGAYVCGSACFEKACATRKFDRALKAQVVESDMNRIAQQMRELKTLESDVSDSVLQQG